MLLPSSAPDSLRSGGILSVLCSHMVFFIIACEIGKINALASPVPATVLKKQPARCLSGSEKETAFAARVQAAFQINNMVFMRRAAERRFLL